MIDNYLVTRILLFIIVYWNVYINIIFMTDNQHEMYSSCKTTKTIKKKIKK